MTLNSKADIMLDCGMEVEEMVQHFGSYVMMQEFHNPVFVCRQGGKMGLE